MYVKTFPLLKSGDIALMAAHSAAVSAALAHESAVIFPQVLGHNETSIQYQLVDCSTPMLERLQRKAVTSDDMEMAGRILASIHTHKKADGATLLHADYVPHNLFYSQSKLVLIDPHPPENTPFSPSRLYGNPYNEVVGLIFVLLTDMGLKKSVLELNYQRQLVKAFLHGYGHKVKFSQILQPLWQQTRDVYNQKRLAGFSHLHSILHCLLAYALTCFVLRLAL